MERENVSKIYSRDEVLEILGISKSTFYKLVSSGELRAVQFCGKYKIAESDLQDFINSKFK